MESLKFRECTSFGKPRLRWRSNSPFSYLYSGKSSRRHGRFKAQASIFLQYRPTGSTTENRFKHLAQRASWWIIQRYFPKKVKITTCSCRSIIFIFYFRCCHTRTLSSSRSSNNSLLHENVPTRPKIQVKEHMLLFICPRMQIKPLGSF